MHMQKKTAAVLCGCVLMFRAAPAVPVSADAAPEFTRIAKYTASTGYNTGVLTDNNENTSYSFPAGGTLTITTEDPRHLREIQPAGRAVARLCGTV